MSGGIYGGDEVGALVFDPGHSTFRIGYAGEDSPKLEIPSYAGIIEEIVGDPTAAGDSIMDPTKRFIVDTNHLSLPRDNMKLVPLFRDASVEMDFDVLEAYLNYSYQRLGCESPQHPALFSESPWTTRPKREKLAELMFEKYETPALFLCKNPVLVAFANARGSGLVLDCGASQITACPVHDGYCLVQASFRSLMGGDVLTESCRLTLQDMGVDLCPSYMVAGKEHVAHGEKPKYKTREKPVNVSKEYNDYMVKELIRDFQKSTLQIVDSSYNEESAEKTPSAPYEFPTGYTHDFGAERLRLPEAIFEPNYLAPGSASAQINPQQLVGVGQVVAAAIQRCDADLRGPLYSSVIVTGGLTLLPGFIERLQSELLQRAPPSARLKLIYASGSGERRFGSWIGGSILGSLGSFQQMWVSRQEFQESGKVVIDRKCP